MSDVAVAAPAAAPAATPNAAPAGELAVDAGGWPSQKIFTDEGTLRNDATDAQPGAETAPNPDEPWQPDEALAARKARLKVDGKEIDIPVGELTKYAQLGIHATKKLQDVAVRERAVEDSHTMLAESMRNPEMFLQNMIDAADDETAIAWIDRLAGLAAQRLQMTPEQRELQRYKRTEEYRQQQQIEQQRAQQSQQMTQLWNKTIQLAGLQPGPVGEAVAAELRERVLQARREGRNETPMSLATFAKRRVQEMNDAILSTLSDEKRRALVRPEDMQQRARESVSKPLVPVTQTPPRDPSSGKFRPKMQTYDPFNG